MRYHGYYSGRYNKSDFQITKREILFSTIIVCVMIGFGVWISNPILKSASESALKTVSSVTVNDAEKFVHSDELINRCFDLLGSETVSCHLKDIILEDALTVRIAEVLPGTGSLNIPHYLSRIDAYLL